MVNKVKLCKDCMHYKESPIVEWCISPYNGIRLTDGSVQRTWAAISRGDEGKCGYAASWFTHKIVEPAEHVLESTQPWKPFLWIKKLW